VQNELDLSALLDMPQLTSLVDESTVLDWKSLRTEKAGANLRNELAHGLLRSDERLAECAYFWWVTLRCVMAPILNAASSEDGAHAKLKLMEYHRSRRRGAEPVALGTPGPIV
jgi:hypothetical protein